MVQDLGTADIDARLEELLIDGILYAFQEQVRVVAAMPMREAGGDLMCVGCMLSLGSWAHADVKSSDLPPGRVAGAMGLLCLTGC